MKKFALGALFVLGLAAAAGPTPGHASPGDGLDRNAAAQGNGRFGGMHRGAAATSRQATMARAYRRHRRYR